MDIKVLTAIEAMRLRPSMYIGDESQRSVNYLVQNVIEKLMRIGGRQFGVILHADKFVTVKASYVGLLPENRRQTVKNEIGIQELLTVAHCGPTHGIDITVTNAYSEQLEVKVERDGSIWEQSHAKGIPQSPVRKTGVSQRETTAVHFLPDKEFFVVSEFNLNELGVYLRERAQYYEQEASTMAATHPGKQRALEIAEKYKSAHFVIIDEREVDSRTGTPKQIQW